jgi:hypothetical protein
MQQGLVSRPEAPRFLITDSRTLIGMAIPLETLSQIVEQTSSVTIVPEKAKGRAAALSKLEEQTAIDFYPSLPD